MTSAMKPYVLDEFTRSSASTAFATVKPNTAVAWSAGSIPSGSDSVFQWARPALTGPRAHGAVPELERGRRQLHEVSRVVHELGLELPRRQGHRAGPHRPEPARVRAGGDRPHAGERVHLVHHGHVGGRQPQLV